MDSIDINDNEILMHSLLKETPQTVNVAKLNILLQIPSERLSFKKFAIPLLTKGLLS